MKNCLNFTNTEELLCNYSGADKKLKIKYDEEIYLLKFPSEARKNTLLSYSNNVFSEYIGCRIFNSVGIEAQKTFLGIYEMSKDKIKTVCACKDFTTEQWKLYEFQTLKNSFITSETNEKGATLEEIIEIIENHQNIINKKDIKDFFWNMFVIDALIGNFDRHNGNWGILVNTKENEMKPAPVYDCGSCLFSQLSDEQMKEILNNKGSINDRVYNKPVSSITYKGKRINYFEFITSLENNECNNAIEKIYPKIDFQKIYEIIDNTPYMSDIRKEFYKTIITQRYDKILTVAYNKILTNKQ